MKANELMIGDLVECTYWTPSKQLKVAEIRRIMDDETKIGVYSDGLILIFRQSEVKPIPLTPEILEKNGFEVTRNMSASRNKDVWSLRVSKDKVFHIVEHHNKRKFPYFWIELGSNSDIKYVHQLQHALRLFGIPKEIEL